MPMLDNGITKLYYTIGEVASMVEEEAHVLRYWETEFDSLRPRKNRAGKRVYTKNDVDVVFRIRHLLRDEKFTIDGARQVLKRDRTAVTGNEPDRIRQLNEIRSFLQRALERL